MRTNRFMFSLVLGLAAYVLAMLPAAAGEKFALLIGNKDYKHTSTVEFAERDLAAVEGMLVNALGFKRQNIITHKNASVGDLRYLLGDDTAPGRIADIVRDRDSELFIYFAGHGSKEVNPDGGASVPYLLGTDSRPERLRGTAYELDTLLAQVEKLQSTKLTEGRITIVLESCFSGRSQLGDLVTGRSAPAFGPPVVMTKRSIASSNRVVLLAAAQGDQFAAWDRNSEYSVFTDALVSGLYGEADKELFRGNGDGEVTLDELTGFLRERVARRMRIVLPGERQDPDILGGSPELVLAKSDDRVSEWPETIRRSYGEQLQSTVLLARGDIGDMEDYLQSCLYCPGADKLRAFISDKRREQTICQIEEGLISQLSKSGSADEIVSFKKICRCCNGTAQLDARLAALGAPVSSSASDRNQDSQGADTSEPIARARSEFELARAVQDELKRVGCLAGRVDGIWGRGSRSAAEAYNASTEEEFDVDSPSEEILAALAGHDDVVCSPNAENATTVSKPKSIKSRRPVYRKKSTTTHKATVKPKTTYKKKASTRSSTSKKSTSSRKSTTRKSSTRKASTSKSTKKRTTTTTRSRKSPSNKTNRKNDGAITGDSGYSG